MITFLLAVVCQSFTINTNEDNSSYTQVNTPYEVVIDYENCHINFVEMDKLCYGDLMTDVVPPVIPTGVGNGSGGGGGEHESASDN